MAENTRKDPRAKVLSMTVRYKSATLDEFIEHHSHDVSRGGMYIKTPQPFPPGTLLKFEVKIAADQKVMQGVGRVVWRRESDDASEAHPAGMGVKFIKIDDDSKDVIDQLITARMGDISAFDEVEVSSERSPSTASEPPPPRVAKQPESEGFFPKSAGDVPQPAPEDRTVMKQATELLQEALREVGNATAGSVPPEQGGHDSNASTKPARVVSVTPAPGRVARASLPAKPDVKSIPTPAQGTKATLGTTVRTPPLAQVAKTPPPPETASPKASIPATVGGKQRFEPVKPESIPGFLKRSATESAPLTVPARPIAAHKPVPAAPAPKAVEDKDEYKLPIRKSGAGRGMRVGIILLLVGGAAAGIVAISRKPAPPPPMPEPTPSVSQHVDSAPVVLNLGTTPPDAGTPANAAPSAEAAASASATATTVPSVEKPVAAALPAAEVAPKPAHVVVPRRKKADAGVTSPSSETPTVSESKPDTTTSPSKPSTDSEGSSDTPAPKKSKSKTPTPPISNDPYSL
jgi:uncharacterized protein (TIGR02266 family)